VLRPVPVTAWLPLAMILFGLGPRSAYFLVFLGPQAGEDRRQGGGQHHAGELRRAAAAEHRRGLEQPRLVVGEMTGVPTGLGAMIMEARQLSRTEIVICGMVAIVSRRCGCRGSGSSAQAWDGLQDSRRRPTRLTMRSETKPPGW
jgi:NitT/TauT family transport system permease protein